MCPNKINQGKPDKKDDEGDQSGGRGTSGKVEVRIASMAGDSRNEPRTPAERRHFAVIHESTQVDRIRRAKERKKALNNLREQHPSSLNQRQPYSGAGGGGGSTPSPYKAHPISQTAYFSGAEESPIPSQNAQDLNAEDREKLEDRPENKLQNRLSLNHTPKYNPPKPRPY